MAADIANSGTLLLALLGLLVGSFLNVLIHRLPKMMELQWTADCAQASGQSAPDATPFNLMVPRSACPQCGAAIAWYDNMPLLSYALLRGRCRRCQAPISPRYPLVELGNGGDTANIVGALYHPDDGHIAAKNEREWGPASWKWLRQQLTR